MAEFNNENRTMTSNGEYWLMQNIGKYFVGKQITVLDVGAHTGKWSLYMNSIKSDAQIYAFEIVPDTFSHLVKKIENYSNIFPFAFGLSNQNGKAPIYLNLSSDTSGLFEAVDIVNSQSIYGQVKRGDDFLKEYNIDHIDLLKIDTEGGEKIVLEGFIDTLKAGKVDVIYFEYGEFNIQARSFLKDFYHILNGFELGRLFPCWVEFGPYDKNLENFRPAYYVAVRNDRRDIIAMLS